MGLISSVVKAVVSARSDLARHVGYYESGKRRYEGNELASMFVKLAERHAKLMLSGLDEDIEQAAEVVKAMDDLAHVITRGPGSDWYAFEQRVLKAAYENARKSVVSR